ncbi:MAG: hypothetical protein H6839_02840 [Planctomycetes bacterium]|nr:hypothetical protein [Planctomycetota bacterium]
MTKPKRKKNRSPEGTGPLEGHFREGKKFYPPLAHYGNVAPGIQWVRWCLPELFWIALVVDAVGLRVAAKLVPKIIAWRPATAESVTLYASDFGRLADNERSQLLGTLDAPIKDALGESFATFTKFYPGFPMSWLVPERARDDAPAGMEQLEAIKHLVRRHEDRRGYDAMALQVLAWVGIGSAGAGVKYPSADLVPDPNELLLNPGSRRSKRDASSLRAVLNFQLAKTNESAWAQAFWEQGRKISECVISVPSGGGEVTMNQFGEPMLRKLMVAGRRFAAKAGEELNEIHQAFLLDAGNPARGEVLMGMLQRQLTLAQDVISNPFYTLPPWAEFVERAMVETYIRAKWLVHRDRKEDYEWFVNYGQGQVKLRITQLRELAKRDPELTEAATAEAEILLKWLDSQHFEWLQVVDVGMGTHDKSLRDLAIEAGCAEQHSLRFQWLSGVVHGHWHGLVRDNLTYCQNPLHGLHRLPYAPERALQASVMLNAMEAYGATFLAIRRLSKPDQTTCASVDAWLKEGEENYFWGLAEIEPEPHDEE